VLLDGARIGAHSRISRSIVGPGAYVGDHCQIDGGAVLGADVKIGSHNRLTAGIRIFPGVELPDSAVAF
jgi:mannose-1-phosphate guanylyltransferase